MNNIKYNIEFEDTIDNLILFKKIKLEDINKALKQFGSNDWGVLDKEEKEDQNLLIIEGKYKGENPKLKYCFNGIYEMNKYLINIRSKYETLTKTLLIKVNLIVRLSN
ncbi:hypothetical protein (plasmid) [Clostridium perfringens str. 13]|uniref:Uncharacterized protein n=1 Tax=Clostridium perfringens (strain 13 / Type A) TaxID=195102 RepID=Q93MC4_CLOPE|nr:hypothetical protein [Clostridium perfringens]BAB62461.1 hypothetical protein [Clostridium perfringens str. 13]